MTRIHCLVCGSQEYFPPSDLVDKFLYSPGFPSNYKTDITCHWGIVVGSNRPILLDFTEMDIEESPDCEKDYLTLVLRLLLTSSSL